MKNHRSFYLILGSLALLGLVFGAFPGKPADAESTLTFTPVADAYVNASAPNSNFGANPSIRIDASPTLRAYLRFDVKGLNGAAVRSAKLRVYANSENNAGYTAKAVAGNTWTEKGITFSNAPAIGKDIKSIGGFESRKYTEIDLTGYIRGQGTYSLALVARNNTQTNLASREDRNHPPKLVLTVSGKTAPAHPTAQPNQTAAPAAGPGATQTPSSGATQPPAATQAPSSGSDPIIFFNGDLVSGNSMARAQSVVALIKSLMARHPGTPMLVASTGDNEQENTPTLADYQQYFGTTYGAFVSQHIYMQVRGNHDVQDAGHGAAYAQYFGPNSHLNSAGQTNYSYDLGSWHITALDQLNGSVNQATLSFLQSDLAAHASAPCKLVYWHVPTYSSGSAHGDALGLKALNQAEYAAGVDIQLNGHDHDYQRFLPINPNGQLDQARGITTFIDGIGGQDGRTGSQTSAAQAASAKYLDSFPGPGTATHAIGVIQFTLHAGSADYSLYDANNGAVLDSGTVTCHKAGSPAPVATATPAPATQPAPAQPPAGGDAQPAFPIRAAFYYPWFPEAWKQQGYDPFTNYHPALGYYSDYNLATVQKHINMMQYAGIQAGIASWWGQGSQTDSKMPLLLKAAAGTPFRWSIYYEPEGSGNPTPAQITSDLTYIRDRYGSDPSYLRVNGRFVVFVYADASDSCGMASRWKQANTVGAYVVLKVFSGYAACAAQPDSWHQYSPAVAANQQGSYSYTISPGFWKMGDSVRLARDPQRWAANVSAWSRAAVQWQLITTFNEWGEGTAVEPAQEWASSSGYGVYLDALHAATSGSAPAP